MLQSFADHRSGDGAGATIGVADYARNLRAVLRKHNFGSTEVIAGGPPLAVD